MNKKHNPVTSPLHYTSHPSGIECIEITRHIPRPHKHNKSKQIGQNVFTIRNVKGY